MINRNKPGLIAKPMRSKSMDWFLYDNGLRLERVNANILLQ